MSFLEHTYYLFACDEVGFDGAGGLLGRGLADGGGGLEGPGLGGFGLSGPDWK